MRIRLRKPIQQRAEEARKKYLYNLRAYNRMWGMDKWSFGKTVDALRDHAIRLERRAGTYDSHFWVNYCPVEQGAPVV